MLSSYGAIRVLLVLERVSRSGCAFSWVVSESGAVAQLVLYGCDVLVVGR